MTAQPDYALAWSSLGAILLDLGDETGARDAFRRALALKPDLRTIRMLASIARQHGDVDEAVELYTRANSAQPGDANTLLSLAGALAERDDLDAARAPTPRRAPPPAAPARRVRRTASAADGVRRCGGRHGIARATRRAWLRWKRRCRRWSAAERSPT